MEVLNTCRDTRLVTKHCLVGKYLAVVTEKSLLDLPSIGSEVLFDQRAKEPVRSWTFDAAR